jgi:hypothetical protein
MGTPEPPFTDTQLEGFRGYFNGKYQDCQDIRALCSAILDKRNGLGMIWNTTDFEGIKKRFYELPRTYWITKVGKALLKNVEMIKEMEIKNG